LAVDRREPTVDQVVIARSFVEARRSGAALRDYPGAAPETLCDAYRVQDAAIAIDGREVAGWKVGRINPPREGANRLAGPIFADQVTHEEGAAMPVIADGFAAAEAEFVLRIGTAPDSAKRSYTLDEARALIDAVHVGIEIASSPYPGINADGAAVTISDFGNNNGLLVGVEAEGWRDGDINGWAVELLIDGERIGSASAATMLDGPFGAARFLFEHMAARGVPLAPGQWISSGAVTGVHEVSVGQRIEARFDGRLSVTCTIEAQ
jgi:2-keto-4-pentenoate hydratase